MIINIDNRPILILDIDETLIHSIFDGNTHTINYRPYLIDVLNGLHKYFNIFIFTAATINYAELNKSHLNWDIIHLWDFYIAVI